MNTTYQRKYRQASVETFAEDAFLFGGAFDPAPAPTPTTTEPTVAKVKLAKIWKAVKEVFVACSKLASDIYETIINAAIKEATK